MLIALLASLMAQASLPPDAAALLSQFPGRELSLSIVVGRAIGSSDSFRAVDSARESVESSQLLAHAGLDTLVTVSGGLVRDRSQYIVGFGTSDNLTETLTLGLSKAFVTGTAVALDFNYQFSSPTYASALAASFPTNYWEPKASITLSQDLWQNALGRASRAGLIAGEKATRAAALGYQDSVEAWFFDLISVYYAAWLSQAELRSAAAAHVRKSKLVSLTSARARSGSADEGDALQAKTGQASALVQKNAAAQDLGDKWRGLVISLKLPESWLAIDPAEIPMGLDDPTSEASKSCGPARAPQESASVARARLLSESADQSLIKARSELNPDLELGLVFGANAQNTVAANGMNEFFSLQHPRWAVTAKLKMPFEFSAERSRVQAASADALKAEALASQASGNFQVDWLSACSNLKQLGESLGALLTSSETQKRRLALDDQRFRLGRVSLSHVLLTDDEAMATESLLNSTQAKVRAAAWKVLRLAGTYPAKIEEMKKLGATLKF